MDIFQPDNFSKSEIRFKEYDGDTAPFLKILGAYFNEPEIVRVEQVDRAEIQTQNFKITLHARGVLRTILLKKYTTAPDAEQISFYLDLLTRLADRGVPVSAVLRTLDRALVATVDGAMYSAFDFIAGNHFSPSEEGLADVARAMASMHLAFNEFDDAYRARIEMLSQKGYYPFNVVRTYAEEDLARFENRIARKSIRDAGEDAFLARLPALKAAVRAVKECERRIAELPVGVVHSDFHPHNVLMEGSSVRAIIDFENVRISQQARDVAFAICKFGKQFFVRAPFMTARAREAERLKDLFVASYAEVKPLSEEEKALMPILAKDTFLRKLLFVLKGVYDEGNTMWINDLPKHIAALEEINYFWPA